MKENVFDVLVYMLENFMLYEDGYEADIESLIRELREVGFDHVLIDGAFDWLDSLAHLSEQDPEQHPTHRASGIRHYSAAECDCLNRQARGLLLGLEQIGVLDCMTREMVIDQLMALGIEPVEPDHVKWVIFMVLNQYPVHTGLSEQMESLVLDGPQAHIH